MLPKVKYPLISRYPLFLNSLDYAFSHSHPLRRVGTSDNLFYKFCVSNLFICHNTKVV